MTQAAEIDLFEGIAPGNWEPKDLFEGVPPGQWGKVPVLSAEPEKGFFARMLDRVTRNSADERAKAANVMALSKVNKISPAEAESRYGELTDEIRDQPSAGSVGRKVAKVAKHVAKHPKETAVGVGESALHVVSAVPAFIGSGLAGTRALVSGGDVPKAVGQVAEALTYEPRSDLGKKLVAPFDELMALPHAAAGAAGDAVYERTGSPELAATVATAIEGLPVAIMARGPLSSALKVITESAPFRMLTVPERGLVVQSLEETVRKNPGMTEADLVRASDQYFKEAMDKRRASDPPMDRTKMVREPEESPGSMTENVMVPGEPVRGGVVGVGGDRVATPPVLDVVKPGISGEIDLFEGVAPSVVEGGVLPEAVSGLVDDVAISPEVVDAKAEVLAHVPASVKKASTAGQNVRTLRGAILAKGGINFQNFTGELRDMVVDVKYLAKRRGRPLDTLEAELKSEGWLAPDEALLNALRDNPAILRRGPLSQDFGDKPVREFTPQEAKIAKEMDFEPEAPPAGNYKVVDAQDLPVGETLTVLDGKGPTGWDTYKVIEKDPFSVTLKDGVTVELKPFDRVQVDVSGIEHKLGSDGLFDGQDVQVDRSTGRVDKTIWKARAASGATAPNEASPSLRPEPLPRDLPQSDENLRPQSDNVKPDVAGGGPKAPTGYASSGAFADIPIVMEMPEIVELARDLMGGKYPRVMAKMRYGVLGLFKPGTGQIQIWADLFKDIDQARKTLAHEIGHLVDWLPDQTMARGNILGRLASLKRYMKHQIEEAPGVGGVHITPKEKASLKAEAKRLLQADAEGSVDGEITATLPVTPEDVLSIFNSMEPLPGVTPALHNYIKGLNTAEKKAIVKAAMKGLVPDDLQRFAAEVRASGSGGKFEITDDAIRAKFEELFLRELKKRRLIHLDTVMKELKDFTHKWKPFDAAADPKYTAYRYKSAELYADAFSAFVTNPGFLKQEAPVYFKSFVGYMENKPEVKAIWDEIQATGRMNPMDRTRHRVGNIREMYQRGHDVRKAKSNEKTRVQSAIDGLMTGLVDKHYAALKQVRKLEKLNTPAGKRARLLRYDLEEIPYIASEAEVYLKRFHDGVMAEFRARDLPLDELGVYVFLRRVIGDRSGIANPLGHTPETASSDLENIKKDWGSDVSTFIEEKRAFSRDLREELIFPLMRESGLFTADQIKLFEETEDYSKFSVVHFLEKQHGSGVSAKVYRQIGTFSEIENPVVATVLQDLSVIRAARINMAKRDMVTVLKDAGLVQPAELRYSLDTRSRVPIDPKDKWSALLTVMEEGKPKHYVVSKDIAEMFEYSPVEASGLAKIMRGMSQPIREILVSKNPVWMARNVIRDYLTTGKNLSEVGITDMLALGKYYKQAFGEVVREVFQGQRSEDIEEMMLLKAIPKNRHWSGWDETMDTELDRLASDFNVIPMAQRGSTFAINRLRLFWEDLERAGRVSELVGKLAAFKYLKERSKKDIREIAHIVRTRVATPDSKRTGTWHLLTNNAFMWSNIGKEGLRVGLESFKEDPGGYAAKTVMFSILPKLMMWGIGSGFFLNMLLGEDDTEDRGEFVAYLKELQRTLNGIPEYDKAMYTVVPLYVNENGKSVYLRFPNDYEGQFFGALAHKVMVSKKYTGHDGAVNLLAEQFPYKPNPLITAVWNLFKYYVKGQNPVDDYRGRNIMPDRTFKAGGKYAGAAMARATWKELGGGVIYDPPYDDLETTASWYEKAVQYPGFNVLGAFLKVSDLGITERIEAENKEIERRKAVEGIVRTEGYIKIMNGEKITVEEAIAISAQKGGARKRQLMSLMARKCGNAYTAAILKAKNNDERSAAWRVMLEDNFTAAKFGDPVIPFDDGTENTPPLEPGWSRLGGDELWEQ